MDDKIERLILIFFFICFILLVLTIPYIFHERAIKKAKCNTLGGVFFKNEEICLKLEQIKIKE